MKGMKEKNSQVSKWMSVNVPCTFSFLRDCKINCN